MIINYDISRFKLIFKYDLLRDLSGKKLVPLTVCYLYWKDARYLEDKYKFFECTQTVKNPNDQGNRIIARRIAFDRLVDKLSSNQLTSALLGDEFLGLLKENYQKYFRQPKAYKSPNE